MNKFAWFNTLIHLGTRSIKNPYWARSIVLVNKIALLSVAISIFYIFFLWWLNAPILSLGLIASAIAFSCVLVCTKFRKFLLAQVLLILFQSLILVIYAFFLGRNAGVIFPLISLVCVSQAIFATQSWWLRWGFSIYIMACIFVVELLDYQFLYREQWSEHTIYIAYLSTLVFAFLFLSLTTQFLVSSFQKARSDTEHLQNTFKLSKREKEVVLKVAQGKSNQQIAQELFIEEGTVKSHLNAIFIKTGVRNRVELVVLFFDNKNE